MSNGEEKRIVSGIPVAQSIPFKGVKKMMADRLVKSNQIAAVVPVVMRAIDVTNTLAFVEKIKTYEKAKETRVTFNHLLLKAGGFALNEVPLLNSSLVENEIVIFEDKNINFAVALENAILMVPVIHQVDKKTIWEVAQKANELTEKAKNRKLKLEDVSRGTFTMTNGGQLGSDLGCGIINQPQSCIMTIARVIEKPVVRNSQIAIRSMLNATISYDHRILSGRPVLDFLRAFERVVGEPEKYDWGI